MIQTVAALLAPQRAIEVVDVGANPIDGTPPYVPLLQAQLCRVTGFEPQEQALARLLAQKGPHERYLPYAVGDGQAHTLNICQVSGLTSLFEPDMATFALFEALRPLAEIKQRVPLQTRRFDAVAEIERVDFLKIDIQGGELAVFRSGKQKLAQAVCIQTEVSFVTLYKDQPSLGDIDLELRQQGFIPHCFAEVKRWPIAPCVLNNNPMQPLNQLLEADLVYMRDFSRPDLLDNEQLKHMALIAHYCYRSYDLVMRCLLLLEQRKAVEPGSMAAYVQILSAPPEAAANPAVNPVNPA